MTTITMQLAHTAPNGSSCPQGCTPSSPANKVASEHAPIIHALPMAALTSSGGAHRFADADADASSPRVSRRNLIMNALVSTAALAAASPIVSIPTVAAVPDDPIFAAIERHRAAWDAVEPAAIAASRVEAALPSSPKWFWRVGDQVPPKDADPEWVSVELALANAFKARDAAAIDLLDVGATTPAGLIALMEYVVGVDVSHGEEAGWPDDDGLPFHVALQCRAADAIEAMSGQLTTAAVVADSERPTSVDHELEEAWQRRIDLCLELQAVSKLHDEAHERLPEWAKPGHECIDSSGIGRGRQVGWPAAEDAAPPTVEGIWRLVRPSPLTVRDEYSRQVRIFADDGPERARFRAQYRAKMRKVIARIRQQDEVQQQVGYVELGHKCDQLCEKVVEIERWIEGRLGAGRPDVLAAALLIDLTTADGDAANCDEVQKRTLDTLRTIYPQLSGLIKRATGALLNSPQRSFQDWEWSPGREEKVV